MLYVQYKYALVLKTFCTGPGSFYSRLDSNILLDRILQGSIWAAHASAFESCLLFAHPPITAFAKCVGCKS